MQKQQLTQEVNTSISNNHLARIVQSIMINKITTTIILFTITFICLNVKSENNIQKKFNPESWYIIDVYLDADYNATTGMKSDWLYTSSGIDYLAQGSFIYKYNGTKGSNEWSWVDHSSVKRVCSFDSTFVEGEISKIILSNPSLHEKFGIAFPYYLENSTASDIIYYPENNNDYQQRKLFTVKPPQIIELITDTELLSSQAYYYPYMRDPDINHYLDFESATSQENKNKQWASWAIDVKNPSTFNVSVTFQSAEPATLQFALIDMATNLLIKTFPTFDIDASNADFTEIKADYIDLQQVPAGKYMLKLNDRSHFSNSLKVRRISIKNAISDTEHQHEGDFFNIIHSNNNISVNAVNHFNISIFSIQGDIIASDVNVTEKKFNLVNGIYLLQIVSGKQVFVKKIILH